MSFARTVGFMATGAVIFAAGMLAAITLRGPAASGPVEPTEPAEQAEAPEPVAPARPAIVETASVPEAQVAPEPPRRVRRHPRVMPDDEAVRGRAAAAAHALAESRLREIERLRAQIERIERAGNKGDTQSQTRAARIPLARRQSSTRTQTKWGLIARTFPNGSRSETEYKDGVKDGREAGWHPDGTPRFVGEYVRGEMHGTWTAWHAGGGVAMTRTFVHGRLDGPLQRFHEDGTLAEQSTYVDGREVGVNRGWHENGELAWEMTYEDGKREGDAFWWHPNGKPKAEGTYEDGKLVGTYVSWKTDGALDAVETWSGGSRTVPDDAPRRRR